MSGSSKRRRSKWDENDSETLLEDSYDKVPPSRPREPSSPGKDSRRHDSRNRRSTISLEREENGTKISPKLEERRPRHSSRSPRNEWGRSHRRSRSRSRSQSPPHHSRREPAPNDRNRSRSRQVCRDFIVGRCRKGQNCHFLHQNDDQLYENRRPLERSSPDESEGRYRRAGSSRYSIEDIKDNAIRAEKTANICNDFLKGRCRRGDTCRYMHHDNRDHDHWSRDGRNAYQDHDHRSRDTYPEHDPDVNTGMDSYSGHDHMRKDMHPKRDYESDSSRKGEILCKFFASGNCRNGTRCRFSHQVQDGFSPERSRDEKRDTNYKFEGRHGWEEDENEAREVNDLRVQDGDRVSEPKFEGDQFHDWRDEKNEISAVVNDMTGARPEGDSLDHNVVIKPTWDPTSNTIDKFQIPDNEDLLQWKTGNNVPIMDFSTPQDQSINQSTNQHEVGFGEGRIYAGLPLSSDNREAGDMEISPRDIKQRTIFDQNQQIPSISDISCPMQNTIHIDNAPQLYPNERSDLIGNHNVSSIIQDQGQDMFQPFGNSDVNPIPDETTQGEGIQEVLNYPSSILENQVDGSHVGSLAGSEPGLGSTAHSTVSDEQLAQLSHITASLTQLLENQQQISQLSSVISPRGMPPELGAPLPLISGAMIEPNQGPVSTSIEEKMPNLGDQSLPIVEQKRAVSEIDEINKLNPRKDEENGKEKVGFKERENGSSRGVDPDDGADDGKKMKDTKGIRPFKFALAEFIKELLKPSWKDGQVSKEAYKIIVKKAVDKVMETLGPQVPQTKEKIDMYLSCSKPKIDKLVQAYVGKHQKG